MSDAISTNKPRRAAVGFAVAGTVAAAIGWGTASRAANCNDISHKGTQFTVCDVDLQSEELRLFLNDSAGKPLGQFARIDQMLEPEGLQLGMAMNAGMYHEDRSPVGHYVEDGVETMRVITTGGGGNFGLLPNGVLCIRDGRADVMETKSFIAAKPKCRYASQSGPMLVIDGTLHPRFIDGGDSRYIRNGVGTTADGKHAVFAISRSPVNFYDFGTLYRDVLKLPNALYFDGNISRLYRRGMTAFNFGTYLGPIVGTVEVIK